MKILVTGAEGMLGSALVRRLRSAGVGGPGPGNAAALAVAGVDLPDGDLADPATAPALLVRHTPDWVVHCAAWTDVDGAEARYAEALAANGAATAHLARACGAAGCGLTYVSTDYVFDGRGRGGDPTEGYDEDDPLSPVNAYGRTKAAGEDATRAMRGSWQIVRTSWLFGDGRVNFVKTIRRLLAERETLQVVDDQRGCPTYAEDLADVLARLVSGRHRGIFHATNRGACTWHELAQATAAAVGADPDRITPCGSGQYPRPAARPACSILRSRRLEEAGCPPRPAWRDAVAHYIARLESGQVAHP
ncbi:MAG: dTDP-4-dehydrorhamnose reductase [bacterium]|nr:dTDP-4-dehydrorhamnose reductase [bacterium]